MSLARDVPVVQQGRSTPSQGELAWEPVALKPDGQDARMIRNVLQQAGSHVIQVLHIAFVCG